MALVKPYYTYTSTVSLSRSFDYIFRLFFFRFLFIESLNLPNSNVNALFCIYFHFKLVRTHCTSGFRNNGVRRKRSTGSNVANSAPDSAGLGKQRIYRTDDVQHKENNGLFERFWYVMLLVVRSFRGLWTFRPLDVSPLHRTFRPRLWSFRPRQWTVRVRPRL